MARPDQDSATRKSGRKARTAQPSIVAAAKAVADVSGTAGTMEAVLEKHALGHYSQGLRQYLAIRSGKDDVKKAFERLRSDVVTTNREELLKPPGIRARLYRRAREIALSEGGEPSGSSTGTLAWFRPAAVDPAYQTGLVRARQELAPDTRELLELRYARELEPDEIAYVLNIDGDEVERRLEKALAEAKAIFAAVPNVDLPQALLQSFALDRLEDEIEGDRDPEDPPILVPGTVLDERYEVEAHVGSGGFADVYRCGDVAVPGHTVALKLLKKKAWSQEQKDAALRELRLIAAVFHPSITQFKDHGWYEGRFWFVMPWYEGESLESRMERGPLTRAQAKRIFVPLARALATMHAAGVRHQDVKPDNIFLAKLKGFGLEDEERVLPVLLDLGVAATDAELILAGTPTYFAPEVAQQFAWQSGGEMPTLSVGSGADIFSLALSLRNALEPSTQPVVAAGAVDSFIRYRAEENPDPPSGKDLNYLEKHFARWMARDPAERPTADELAEELAVLTLPEERRERRLRLLRVFGPLVLMVAVIFGVVVYELQQQAKLHSDKAAAAEQLHAEALAELDEASAEQEDLQRQIQEAEGRIESSQLSRHELAEQLATAQGRLAVTRRALRNARRSESELQKSIQTLEGTLAVAETTRDTAQRRVAQLEGTLARRESELSQARRTLDERNARVQQLQRDLSTAQNQQRSLEGSIAALSAQRDQAQQNLARVERERDQARAQLQQAQNQIRDLQRRLQRAQQGTTVMIPTPTAPSVPIETPTTQSPTTQTPTTMATRPSRMATRR